MKNIISKLEDMYNTTKFFEIPQIIQCDNGFDTEMFRKWCNDNDIHLKISDPYNHRANAYVERLNQSIGNYINQIQEDIELETGKTNSEWIEYLPDIIKEINDKHIKTLNKTPEKIPDEIVINKNNNYVIENDTKVRMKLENPISLQGKKLHGNFRKTDIRWSPEIYTIVEHYWILGNPILYQIKDSKGKILKNLYVTERLQII